MANAVNNAAKIKTLLQFMSRQLRTFGDDSERGSAVDCSFQAVAR